MVDTSITTSAGKSSFLISFLTAILFSGSAWSAPLKIAIFDYDFKGYEEARGRSLPNHVVFRPGIVEIELPPSAQHERPHGLVMAEILHSEIGNKIPYDLYLYDVRGFSNFQEAVSNAIRDGIDLIIHPMVRDYGSNFDGRGFVNAEVNRALQHGIIWFNAAGNFGKTSYTGQPSKYDKNSQNWVEMPGYVNSLPFKCAPPKEVPTCKVRITLSWTGHSDDPLAGTDKDLDMLLADDTLKTFKGWIEANRKQVVGKIKNNSESNYPREVIEAELKPGQYTIRVSNRSENFTDSDRYRIATDNPYIEFEYYDSEENIFNPADNPGVITVGASDSDRSSQSVSLGKPEVKMPSFMQLPNGQQISGSSVAVTRAAARAALYLASNRSLSRERLISLLNNEPATTTETIAETPSALSTTKTPVTQPQTSPSDVTELNHEIRYLRERWRRIGFTSTRPNCFERAYLPPQAPYISFLFDLGGVVVQTTAGLKIAVDFDPIELNPNLKRIRTEDMVLATPMGIILRPRHEMPYIPRTWAEVFQLPPDKGICQ